MTATTDRYRVAMDIGGTFTDFVIADTRERRTFTGKALTTPDDPARGVMAGLRDLIPDASGIGFCVHGTTVGLNAFLERRGTRVLLIMTAGVRDAYSIARGDRKELYALQYRKPDRLVPRRDVMEVRERLRWDGSVMEPMHEDGFGPIIDRIRSEAIEAVAVCLVHAYVNPTHELRAREILKAGVPALSVTLSHEVAREWREYERASSAVLNAYIAPKVESYLNNLERDLHSLGITTTLHVMQSSGGVMTSTAARDLPIQTLLSGPVGGTIGGAGLSEATGRKNVLCIDMGGTSFDMSLIVDGRPSVSTETELEGLPILMPLVDIHTIGAGGGSLAWLEAGALRVGPQSAGADPGPACYDRGGAQPTVTDANLFLGRLDARFFLGGRMALNEAAAGAAIHRVAADLGLDDVTLAEGMLSIINARMADAMRTITVKQGIDPRDFSLVAFGGAGPMHAVWLARELDIREVIVPGSPGTFSAWGMLHTDVRHDLTKTFYRPLAGLDAAEPEAIYRQLEQQGAQALLAESVAAHALYFARSADMRYVGQEYSVNVPAATELSMQAVEKTFHEAHQTRYGHSTPDAPVEFVNLRVAAMGRLEHEAYRIIPGESSAVHVLEARGVIFDGVRHQTESLLRGRLTSGERHRGPVIVEEDTATTVVPPGHELCVDSLGNLLITPDA
jgi:N-methylhydantoinase A